MSNTEKNTLTSRQWMHSCYEVRDDISILTVVEKIVTIDANTNEVLEAKPQIRQLIDPKRRVWITKPEYRRHRYKKEFEDTSKCDVYQVPDRLLVDFLKEKMGISKYKFTTKKKLCDSPYIYGTDISMEALVRFKYESNQKHAVVPFTVGSLDIETDMCCDAEHIEDRPTNCCTVICDKDIYTVALREFVYDVDEKTGERTPSTIERLKDIVGAEFGDDIENNEFKLHARIVDTEKELYDYIFTAIKKSKIDYLFIWNIGFDAVQLINRMLKLNLDPKDYFCCDDIPKSSRYLCFHEDKKKISHVVEKWNWLHCTSYTQWLCALAVYGQSNKQKPKKSKYDLSSIMTELLNKKKLDLGGHSHRYMQKNKFMYYWAYNIYDALLVQLGNWKTMNYSNLYGMTEHSTLMDFSKQTVMLCNDYHHALLAENKVLASTGSTMTGPYDNLFSKTGGAVVDARNTIEIGNNCLGEFPDRETNVLMYAADNDFESLYPSIKIACAIDKSNKLATIVGIEGHDKDDIEKFCSAIANPEENAVWLGSTFFGLPSYTEMEKLIANKLANSDVVPF